ncbi:MAG: PAS domain S-box protein [Betaproteobacteria bacterium]|nr:MAG: PAS domain S-box protein [Betaproteobacteria bacterium]TMH91857.1 MAG: PAS domain S-box protein [Betaproteobacteria bacterium]
MQRVPGVGQTGEVGLCERRAERLHCFPTRFTERVFSTPLLNEAGEPLPMTHALRGETGVVITADYRAQTVVAAHGPVGDLGLGMVVKIDAAEIFRPIREQLELALGLLVLLAVGGALLLRSQVKPVATRLIDAENRARSQERRFKDLIEFAPEAMVIVNQHGNIVLVNSLAEKLFGYSRTELLGQRIEVLLPEHYRGQHTVQRGEFFASPRARPMHAGLDLHGRRKDGTEFPADISLSPLETEEGTLVSSAVRDITDRKRIESTLQEKNVELANAMQAKDRFVASMSHELRTPLNAIIGFTGTLLMKLPGPLNADQEKQLRTVQTGANHLLALINDLLDLAKIEAGKVELSLLPADCQEVIEEVAAALRPQAEAKGLELTATVPQGLTVRTDRRALSQIVINLANNAIKFTERGSIRIRAERREEDGSRALEISVEDTGIGIRPEDQKKLFGAFTQVDDSTNRRYEGTGLGLHLSRKLAEALEGRIEVKSEYGKGSIFTLVLPEG